MGGDPRVQHLLEEILDSDRSPEEVCSDCAELLPQVRERLNRFRVVEAQVEDLFPEKTATSSNDARPSGRAARPSSHRSPGMMCRHCWATVAWGSSIRLWTYASTVPSRSRCC